MSRDFSTRPTSYLKAVTVKPVKNSSFDEKGTDLQKGTSQKEKETLRIGGTSFEVKRKGKNTKTHDQKQEKITSGGHLLKHGRHMCHCEGSLHVVLTNCLNCGRIICEQEKYGDCMYCGKPVNPRDTEIPKSQKQNTGLITALERRDKLLEYDKLHTQRTVVHDEQTDYYESDLNHWLSEDEKKIRKEKEEKLKHLKEKGKTSTYTIDFTGRRVFEEVDKTQDEISKVLKELQISKSVSERVAPSPMVGSKKLQFKENKENPLKSTNKSPTVSRVQDDYFGEDINQEIQQFVEDKDIPDVVYENPSKDELDSGKCMSMHQPWASMLVQGIKKHEGRFWETEYRGRLWIAATAQEPTEESIQEMEEYYKKLGRTNFPKNYPTSALLGCVDVIDVIDQKNYPDYCKKHKIQEESESEHVFICKNPRKLVVPFSISGKPYIWNLDNETKRSALLGLRKLPKK